MRDNQPLLVATVLCAILLGLIVGFTLYLAEFQAASILFVIVAVVVVAAILFHALFEVAAIAASSEDVDTE